MKASKILFSIAVVSLLLFSGCQTYPPGDGSESVNKAKQSIVNVESQISDNNVKKLESIGLFAYGTNFALSRLYEYPSFSNLPFDFKSMVDSAVTTNNMVRELAPSPNSEKMIEMENTIKSLASQLETERENGIKKITEFELQVQALNKKSDDLTIDLQKANNDFKNLTIALGKEVDSLNGKLTDEKQKNTDLQNNLDKFDEGFGGYAIWHGLKVFFNKIMWISIGLTVAFFVLKAFAASNPIAGSIFSVFESIVGFFIKGVFSLFPRAVKFSGNIDLPTFNSVKNSRDKLVDTMESLYRIEKATPGKTFSLSEVFDELEKNMDEADKKEIKLALEKLGWK